MKSLAFTGHRPKDLGGYNENNPIAVQVKAKLRELILQAYTSGYKTFISGMAMGVDQWAAIIVIELKEDYPDITLIAAVPFAQQASVWYDTSKKSWYSILSQCDEIYIVDKDPDEPVTFEEASRQSLIPNTDSSAIVAKKLNDRNKWMVNRATSMLAIWRHTPGGTGVASAPPTLLGNERIEVYCSHVF